MAKKCQHLELRRARDEDSDGLIDVWYCPERGCTFELKQAEAVRTFNGEPLPQSDGGTP